MIRTRILIVEDTLGIVRPLQRALSLTPGIHYRVASCTTGEEALQQLRAKDFDLLVTDLRLPGMDGLELLEQVREICPHIRSILITAYGTHLVEKRAHQLGAVYLPKPFRLNEIIRIVHRILEEQPLASLPKEQVSEAEASESLSGELWDRRRATHLKVLAFDLDGTLAHNGLVEIHTWDLLRKAKIAGLTLILSTGRTLDTFVNEGPFTEIFEALVLEDGAVVYFPLRDTFEMPFGRLPANVIQRLEDLQIPLERGMSIVATRVPHDKAILEVLQEENSGGTIEYNRGAVMLSPLGATKGTGLAYALKELGYSPRNLVVCGDGENDRSMFEIAELAVAVPNAIPRLKALADVVIPEDKDGHRTGLETLIEELLTRRGPAHRVRPEHRLVLGYTHEAKPVYLDPVMLADSRMGFFGASSSGKSWLAGLLTEELFRKGYQVCIIDPEGDYRSMASSTHSLLLGFAQIPLPPIADVFNFIEWNDTSLVLDLSTYETEDRLAYVLDFLRALHGLRARRGRPHWVLIDEIQGFCHHGEGELLNLLIDCMQDGIGFGIVSYRPSQVPPVLLEKLDHWLLTRISLPEELQVLRPYLAQDQEGNQALASLPKLPFGQAYLCSSPYRPLTAERHIPVRFHTGPRTVPHYRHLHKYLRALLPPHKRFYFCDSSGNLLGYTAANLWEFRETLGMLPLISLRYHLHRGDFERWLREVLRDTELAHRVQKLASRDLKGEDLRQAMLEVVINRYEELENLL